MLRWLLFLTAALTPSVIASQSPHTSSRSLTKENVTRIIALTCHLDPATCTCAKGPLGPPPTFLPGVCVWDATTCQCGRDYQDTGTFDHSPGLPVPAGQICVVDTDKCQCLAGSPPLLSFEALVDKAKTELQALKTKLEILNLGGSQTDPPTITADEVIALIALLKEIAAKASIGAQLKSVELKALVEFLGEETAYLAKLHVDPTFMAALRGNVEAGTVQPIAVRLRAMLTGLEKVSLKTE